MREPSINGSPLGIRAGYGCFRGSGNGLTKTGYMPVVVAFARRALGSPHLVEWVVVVWVLGWLDGTALPVSAWGVDEIRV